VLSGLGTCCRPIHRDTIGRFIVRIALSGDLWYRQERGRRELRNEANLSKIMTDAGLLGDDQDGEDLEHELWWESVCFCD
jgi:hypothetical protein